MSAPDLGKWLAQPMSEPDLRADFHEKLTLAASVMPGRRDAWQAYVDVSAIESVAAEMNSAWPDSVALESARSRYVSLVFAAFSRQLIAHIADQHGAHLFTQRTAEGELVLMSEPPICSLCQRAVHVLRGALFDAVGESA